MICPKCGKEMYINTSSYRWVCWKCGNWFYRYQGDEEADNDKVEVQ